MSGPGLPFLLPFGQNRYGKKRDPLEGILSRNLDPGFTRQAPDPDMDPGFTLPGGPDPDPKFTIDPPFVDTLDAAPAPPQRTLPATPAPDGSGLIEAVLAKLLGGRHAAVDDPPIVPNRGTRQPFSLDDMANADVVGTPRRTWKSDVGNVLEGMASTNLLDPDSENGVESFLGSALNAFGGVRQAGRAFADRDESIDSQIVKEALAGRRQARTDQMGDDNHDIAVLNAAINGQKAMREDQPVDVAGIAAALRAKGYEGPARYAEANPNAVRNDPGVFFRLLDGGSERRPMVTDKSGHRVYDEPGVEVPTTMAARGGAATEGERKGAAYYTMAQAAAPIIEQMTTPTAMESLFSRSAMGNTALDSQRQTFLQASNQFIEQWLRLTSGATITPSERQEAFNTYIPVYGDKPEVIEAKRKMRAQALRAIKTAAGRAAVTDAPSPDDVNEPGDANAARRALGEPER